MIFAIIAFSVFLYMLVCSITITQQPFKTEIYVRAHTHGPTYQRSTPTHMHVHTHTSARWFPPSTSDTTTAPTVHYFAEGLSDHFVEKVTRAAPDLLPGRNRCFIKKTRPWENSGRLGSSKYQWEILMRYHLPIGR